MILPKIPHRWTVRGSIPRISILAASESELSVLDEDLLEITDISRQFAIDVGWYPAGDRDGRFVGRIVVSDDWLQPAEQFETRNVELLRHWLKGAIDKVRQRAGQEGQFVSRIGIFFYPKPARRLTVKPQTREVSTEIIRQTLAPDSLLPPANTHRAITAANTATMQPYTFPKIRPSRFEAMHAA